MELRLQPKIGRLAHPAAVVLSSAGWTKSSREQAPACYTSARHQSNRRETDVALLWDQGSSLAHAAERATLTDTTPISEAAAGGLQAPGIGGPLPAESSQQSRPSWPMVQKIREWCRAKGEATRADQVPEMLLAGFGSSATVAQVDSAPGAFGAQDRTAVCLKEGVRSGRLFRRAVPSGDPASGTRTCTMARSSGICRAAG